MNREIKFRAKGHTDNQWLYGNLATDRTGLYVILPTEDWSKGDTVFEDTIGQFTGLSDKKKVEVYEHDILRVFDRKSYFNVTVVWSDKAMAFMCCFCDNNLSPLSWFSNILSKCYEIEVIGNIFDNPELLEE